MCITLEKFGKLDCLQSLMLGFVIQSCEQRLYVETEDSEVVNTCWALLGLMAVRYVLRICYTVLRGVCQSILYVHISNDTVTVINPES